MKMKFRIITSVVALAAVALALFLFTSGSSREPSKYKMVNVGGQTNQCDCTHRIER